MKPAAAALALLFIALCPASFAQTADDELAVAEGAALRVTCALGVERRADWRLDGRAPPPDMRASELPAPAGAGLLARLDAARARPHHAGRYTCEPRARAVRVRVLPAPAAGTAAASPPPPAPAAAADDDADVVMYALHSTLRLNCTADGVNTLGVTFAWTANGTSLDESALKGRYKLADNGARLVVERAQEADYGNYSCSADGEPAASWSVRALPLLRMPRDANVVEGQKLKLTCRVVGKPYPRVHWQYHETEPNGTDVLQALEGRVTVQDSPAGVPGGELVLSEARRTDAGVYSCHAADALPAATTVRVKDMYAALWPFLGICAEVFVLCAIILVYERRRTKPECEDSDTDNHDQ